ncbi:MAG: 3-dehydroquinate synthase [Pirellulales bacterium]
MTDPFGNCEADSYDVEFAVPIMHRLRFTNNCFGEDLSVIHRLLDAGDQAKARVQVCLDDGLDAWQPALAGKIEQALRSANHVDLVTDVKRLPGGESVKNNPAYVDDLLREFNDNNLDRRSYVMVVGGGAVLDTVGYAAAVAHRGIRLIRVPTTTLAQADSGVGVKNAVNWFNKKNWKGTFATPWAVINDCKLLAGLSDRDFRCGFSEALKVALLKDRDFFEYLCRSATAIAARSPEESFTAIRRSVLLHLKHITRGGDPFENLEARPLDFGHWSAHKLEAITNYSVRHGEAVGVGVAVDTAYSHLCQGLPLEIAEQTLKALGDLQLPIWHSGLSEDVIFDGLEEFRQHLGGRLTITLIQGIGSPIDVHSIDRVAMREAMQWVSSVAAKSACNANSLVVPSFPCENAT